MRKLLIHIAVWVILTYILFFSLSLFLPMSLALWRAIAVVALLSAMFYISGSVLTTALLIRRERLGLFLLAAFLLCVAFTVLRVKLLSLLPDGLKLLQGEFADEFAESRGSFPRKRNFALLLQFGLGKPSYFVSFMMSTAVLIIAVLLRLYEHKTQKEQENREQLQRSQEAQITYLKSQVNPHFLFNTLNNLYGLTYSKSELAPQMVLRLSETMRYMIYETEQKLVPAEKELNFISNYLELEKTRISYPENIRLSVRVKQPEACIPPLLLLPFIENCFKHGTIGKDEEGWMELDIWDEQDNFYFVCKNNYREPGALTENQGIGLANVRKRLDLIFNGQYELRIVKQNEEYMVSLQFPVFSKNKQQ